MAAADRRGLLAAVAGCLALHRLDVVAADACHGRRPGPGRVPGAAPLRLRRRTRSRSPPTCAAAVGRRRLGHPAAARPGAGRPERRRGPAGRLAPGGGHRRGAAGAAGRRRGGPALPGRAARWTRPARRCARPGSPPSAATWWTRSTWSVAGRRTSSGPASRPPSSPRCRTAPRRRPDTVLIHGWTPGGSGVRPPQCGRPRCWPLPRGAVRGVRGRSGRAAGGLP